MIKTDILIIGSGAAGMTSAIELSKEFEITLISKNTLVDSSTWYAQGGIAAVIDEKDSTEDHLRDTLIAGDGLCNVEAVRECVSKGKEAIDWLSDIGTSFTRDKSSNNYHLQIKDETQIISKLSELNTDNQTKFEIMRA